jgi:hypothetical protein
LIDTYRDAVRNLSDFASDYGRCSLTDNILAVGAKQLRVLANRDFSDYPMDKKLDHIVHIASIVDSLFSEVHPDLKRVEALDDPDQTYMSLLITEPMRFAKIVEKGYEQVFNVHDAPRVRDTFQYKLPGYGPTLTRFKVAIFLFSKDLQEFSLHELGYTSSDLLMSIRELSSLAPTDENRYGQFLSDKYVSFRSGCENSMKFIVKLNKFREHMAKVYEVYGWDPDDLGMFIKGTDVDMYTLDPTLDDYIDCILETHVRFTLSGLMEML